MFTNLQGPNLRLVIGIIFILGLGVGCTVKVPVKVPQMFIENKIPYRVVLVIPEDIRQRVCKHPGPTNFNKFNCGSALYETCAKTMDKVYIDVQTVKEIGEARKPWDRTLWLEVDEFKMVGHRFGELLSGKVQVSKAFEAIYRVCLTLRYKLTDDNNNELFSSNISFEEKLSIVDETQLAFSTKSPLNREQRAFSQVIKKTMVKMVKELMEAYKKGQI